MIPSNPPIDGVKRYEYVTKMLIHLNDKIIESLNLFLKVYSAIVGGFFWLSIQQNAQEVKKHFLPIVPFLFAVVGLFSIVLVTTNLKSWWGYRKIESQLVGLDRSPMPKFPASCICELFMIAIIVIVTVVAVLYSL